MRMGAGNEHGLFRRTRDRREDAAQLLDGRIVQPDQVERHEDHTVRAVVEAESRGDQIVVLCNRHVIFAITCDERTDIR